MNYRGREWNYTVASQETPKIMGKPAEDGKKQGKIPSRFQREHSPIDTLTLYFSPTELWGNTFLCFKSPSL